MAKSFQTMSQLNDDTLMIVDSLNLGFRFAHSGQTSFVEEYHNTVESLRKSYQAKYVVIACDKGSSSYRKGIYPEYKGNRAKLREEQTEEDKKKFEIFFEEFNRVIDAYVETDIYPVFRFEKTEADDVVAHIRTTLKLYPHIRKVVLISSDRDYDLLLHKDENLEVMRFSYVTRKEYTIDNYSGHYSWQPSDYVSIKAIMGDTGDNIIGVKGIGPKKAHSLVKEYGDIYEIIANLPISSKYKYIQTLNEFGADALLLNLKLVDLLEFCDEALGPDNCTTIDNKLEKYLNAN